MTGILSKLITTILDKVGEPVAGLGRQGDPAKVFNDQSDPRGCWIAKGLK
jgi:hypothetical protein